MPPVAIPPRDAPAASTLIAAMTGRRDIGSAHIRAD